MYYIISICLLSTVIHKPFVNVKPSDLGILKWFKLLNQTLLIVKL